MNENMIRAESCVRASDSAFGHEKHEGFISPCFRVRFRAPGIWKRKHENGRGP